MHGKPDEGGYAAGDGQLVANQGSSPDYVFMKNIYYNIIDAQPDEFFYDFNGKSGRFFYGPDGQVHQEPKTGLDIRKSSNGYWEIVDLNGTVYRFGESGMTERTRNQVNDPFTSAYMAYYVSAWLMTSITSGTGVETAKFAYTPEHLITTNSIAETVSEQIYHYWNEDIKCDSPTKHKITTSEGLNYTRFVASIELPVQDERVDMTYTCGAVGGTPCRLDEATLSYRGLPKERYALAYYDLKHPSDPSHRENRLFLKAVHTFDVRTSGVASSYSLEYNDLYGLPSYDSFAIDHWGFYNGETTNGNKISDCYQSGCLVPDYVLHTRGGGQYQSRAQSENRTNRI